MQKLYGAGFKDHFFFTPECGGPEIQTTASVLPNEAYTCIYIVHVHVQLVFDHVYARAGRYLSFACLPTSTCIYNYSM